MNVRRNAVAAASVLVLALAAGCGKKEEPAAAPAASPASAPPATQAVATSDAGRTIYNRACALCHAAAVAGAPKPGDKDDWAPRIAQGDEILYKHAIEGYTGSKGAMPARGGNASLSDDDVKAAVDFLVAQSR